MLSWQLFNTREKLSLDIGHEQKRQVSSIDEAREDSILQTKEDYNASSLWPVYPCRMRSISNDVIIPLSKNSSSTNSTISISGENVPFILYKLSTATNTLCLPTSTSRLSEIIFANTSRKACIELWLNVRWDPRTLDARTPEACIYSSETMMSPGTQEKNPKFASRPELKSKTEGALKNCARRSSKSLCARPLTKSREPPDPSTFGADCNFEMKWDRIGANCERGSRLRLTEILQICRVGQGPLPTYIGMSVLSIPSNNASK
jgi:hypothetical protein